MQTAISTECHEEHAYNGKRGDRAWDVYEWNRRRYTVCAHPEGETGYCGALIDVTELRRVTICCGKHDR